MIVERGGRGGVGDEHLKIKLGSLHGSSAPKGHQDGIIVPGNDGLGVSARLKQQPVFRQGEERQSIADERLLGCHVAGLRHRIHSGCSIGLLNVLLQAGCAVLQLLELAIC